MAGGEPRASASDGGSGSVGGQERGVVAGGEGAVVVGGERGAGVAGVAGAAGSVAGGERAAVAGGETESVAGSEGGAGVVDAAGSVAGDGRGAVASDEDAAVADGETELVAKGEDAAEVGGAAGIVAGGEPWVSAGDSGPDVATAIVPARAPAVPRRVDVLVVGAGPAGLTAAARLAAAGAGRVEVLERDTQPGGVPRYCVHGGFGAWLRPLTGPRYARLLAEAAERAGAAVRTGVSALDWGSAGPVLCTAGPDGPETVEARAVVLATGARERPRAARLVPGTRPAGVFTTGELQQAVHLFGQHIGNRAVVVGAEDVSCTAADTVRAAGAQVVALVTELPRARTSRTRARSALLRHGVPLLTETTVTELLGHGRLSGVRVRHRDGRGAVVPCDTVVFTGDFVPEHELARRGGLALDPATRGPAVDGSLHTSRPGVFAAGNLLHAAERARAAASEGVRVAEAVLAFLASAS
ncbi:Thioredoxin reductase [Streptomyces sp. 1222.5]|nr:thioredoxin reductase [Streptomyces sp. 5112.2]SEB80005.1 Thioredoxin reductase [Streptomyces sp. 1222.5]